jgi:hypothetical protein
MKLYWMNLYGIAALALVMAFIFLSGFTPRDPIVVPVDLGFIAISMLAGATGSAVRAIGHRLNQNTQGGIAIDPKSQSIQAEQAVDGNPY